VESTKPTTREANASLVCGIVSIPLCFFLIGGLLAFIFGVYGIVYSTRLPNHAGLTRSLIGVSLGIITAALGLLVLGAMGTTSD